MDGRTGSSQTLWNEKQRRGCCSTVRNWVHRAEFQPVEGQQSLIAVDETMIRLDDEPLLSQIVSATHN
jgi:hypothetical protein